MEFVPGAAWKRCVDHEVFCFMGLPLEDLREIVGGCIESGELFAICLVQPIMAACACGCQVFLDVYVMRSSAPEHVGRACAECGKVVPALVSSDAGNNDPLRARFEAAGTLDAFLASIERDTAAPTPSSQTA